MSPHLLNMMENLEIEGTFGTPEVSLGAESGELKISGRSLPEDSIGFYEPLFAWLEEYKSNLQSKTRLIIEMDYFNTASTSQLLNMMLKVEEFSKQPNKEISIEWGWESGDEIMKQRGQELSSIVGLEFTFHNY